jgi:transcriptional regulator with XRE-family HTH domain
MTIMLMAGTQLRAARAMAGLDRQRLAEMAELTAQTVKRLEGMDRLRATMTTVERLQRALEAAGVVFTDGDEPGVKMRRSPA